MPRGPKKTGPAPTPPTAESVQHAAVQPPRAPTGLPQGEHQALIQAQQAQPVEDSVGGQRIAIQQAMAAADAGQHTLGGGDTMLHPTASPLEPVTAGLPMGAGPGPEAIQAPAVPDTVDDHNMARFLPMLEALADRPDATDALRIYVRRVRGTTPPDITMQSIVRH